MQKRELTPAQQAKKELKKHFPNCKFSVTTVYYRSFRVNYSFGPSADELKEVIHSINEDFEFFISRDFSTEFEIEVGKAWAKKQGIEFESAHSFDPLCQRNFSSIIHELLNDASFKTNAATFKAIKSSGISCGSIGEVYLIDFEETTKEGINRPDVKAIQTANIAKEKEEKRLYDIRKAKEKEQQKIWQAEEAKAKEREKSYKYEIFNIKDQNKFMSVQCSVYSKMNEISEYHEEIRIKGEYSSERMKISELIKCDANTFRALSKRLMYDHEIFNGKGGTDSNYQLPKEFENVNSIWELPEQHQELWKAQAYNIGIFIYCTDLNQCIVVDPQGYKYARYVHLLPITNEFEEITKADKMISEFKRDHSYLKYKGRKKEFFFEVERFLKDKDIEPTDKLKKGFWDYLQNMSRPDNFHFGYCLKYLQKNS